MRKMNFALSLSCFAFSAVAYATPMTIPVHNTLFDTTCCLAIAHAGGGFAGDAYTNSKQALEANYAFGRRVFELDFDKTSDGVWVLTHGWRDWADETDWEEKRTWYQAIEHYFADKPYIPTQAEFVATGLHETTPLTLTDFVSWLSTHSDVTIVLDTQNSLPALFETLKAYPHVQNQLVYQAYSESDLEFLKAQHISLSRVIFSNYKINLTDDALIALVQRDHIGAIAIDMPRALAGASMLREKLAHTPIYVHGRPVSINSFEVQFRLKNAGVSGFYLD